MADIVQAWIYSTQLVKLRFFILFGVVIVTLVRVARVWWARRRHHSATILVQTMRSSSLARRADPAATS